jgi:hypothetical protein
MLGTARSWAVPSKSAYDHAWETGLAEARAWKKAHSAWQPMKICPHAEAVRNNALLGVRAPVSKVD